MTTTPTNDPIPMINGLDCPACGHPTLILGLGGYVTCAYIGCSNPDYAEAITAHIAAEVEKAQELMGEAIIARHRQANGQFEKTQSFIQSYQTQLKEDPHGIIASLQQSQKGGKV